MYRTESTTRKSRITEYAAELFPKLIRTTETEFLFRRRGRSLTKQYGRDPDPELFPALPIDDVKTDIEKLFVPDRTPNKLKHYVVEREHPAMRTCYKGKMPEQYQFKCVHLHNDDYAYDMQVDSSDEEDASEDYKQFTKYLKSLKTYDDGVRMTSFLSSVQRPVLRRARSFPAHFYERDPVMNARDLPEVEPGEPAATVWPHDREQLRKTESAIWPGDIWCSHHVGWLKGRLGPAYGPDRFYILSDDDDTSAEYCYDFNKLFTAWLAFPGAKESLVHHQTDGVLVYHDKVTDRFSRVWPIPSNCTESVHVLNVDTAEIHKVDDVENCLRVLPEIFLLRGPLCVPVRLITRVRDYEFPIVEGSWEKYLQNIKENGRIYITRVEKGELTASLVAPDSPPTLERTFCSFQFCRGKCLIHRMKRDERRARLARDRAFMRGEPSY